MCQELLAFASLSSFVLVFSHLAKAADDRGPDGEKRNLVVAPFLKEVAEFRRKVVFFHKDVDLPCLKVLSGGEKLTSIDDLLKTDTPDWESMRQLGPNIVMDMAGNLVFCTDKALLRTERNGSVRRIASLATLTVTGGVAGESGLHFEDVLAASKTKDTIYLALSTMAFVDGGGQDERPPTSFYIGKWQPAEKRLTLLKTDFLFQVSVDPEADLIYEPRPKLVSQRRFDGKPGKQWPVRSDGSLESQLAPDRKSLLLSSTDIQVSVLDLEAGRETELPIKGRAVWWAPRQVFYIQEDDRGDGVLDISLCSFTLDKKEPKRLFKTTAKPRLANLRGLGLAPILSADGTWLAWELPIEDAKQIATILLDLRNNEYRVLGGIWRGVKML